MAPLIAADFGGSHIACAVMQEKICLAKRTESISYESFKDVLPVLEGLIRKTAEEAEVAVSNCAAVVVGFPGIVDVRTARVVSTNAKFDDAKGFDLRGWVKGCFGLPVLLENDARLAVMGEHFCGAGEGVDDLVLVMLGTGIGASVLIGGKPLRGHASQAGALGGHLPVVLQGRKCTCGNVGCAEAEASTWALQAICEQWPGFNESFLATDEAIDFRKLFAAKDRGDHVATAVLQRCLDVWSALSVALIHAYTPRVLVFGGSVMARHADILPYITSYVRKHAWLPEGEISIREAELGSSAALYGAVPLFQEVFA